MRPVPGNISPDPITFEWIFDLDQGLGLPFQRSGTQNRYPQQSSGQNEGLKSFFRKKSAEE
jgi:hypothetical protein